MDIDIILCIQSCGWMCCGMFCRVVCEQSYLFPFMVILSLSATCCVFMRTFRVRVHFPWVESYISYKTAHNHSCTSVCSISNLRSPGRAPHILVAAVGSAGEDIPPSSRTHGEDICLRSEPARKTFRIISGDALSQGRYPHLPEEDIPNPNRLRTTGASCYSREGQQLDLATAEDHSVDGLTRDKDPHILSEQFELSVV